MKKNVLIHASWLAVATGAWLFGRLGPGGPGASRSPAPLPATSPIAAPRAPGVATTGREAALPLAGRNIEDPAQWASRFRDAEGRISPERMTEAVIESVRDADPLRGMMNFTQLMREMTAGNAPAAFQAVRTTITGWESMRYLPMLTAAWGGLDGENALAKLKETGGREAMFGSAGALSGWAAADPAAAQKWLKANNGEENAGFLSRGLVSGMARTDFTGATAYVTAATEEQKGELTSVLTEQQLKSGLGTAIAWTETLTDPKMKASALSDIARQFSRQDLDKAAAWVAGMAADPAARDAVGRVAGDLAEKDPARGLAWAGTLPAGDGQSEAYSRVFREWAPRDPTAASTSLNALPPGPSRDSAISAFSSGIGQENPQDAIQWASTISDPALKTKSLVEAGQHWFQTSPDDARAWAAAHLPAEAQSQITQAPRRDWRGFGPPRGR